MKLTITLTLTDAVALHQYLVPLKGDLFFRIREAIRGAQQVALPTPATPLLELGRNDAFLEYLAALDWWLDGDADEICKLLRREWESFGEFPGVRHRLNYGGNLPADFATVKAVEKLLACARARLAANRQGKYEVRITKYEVE